MKVVEMDREHLRRIKVRPLEMADINDNFTEEDEDFFLSSQYKKAVIEDGEVVMVMGGVVEGEYARTWLMASDLIYKNPIASLEIILHLHEEAVKKFKVKYLYTLNLPEFTNEIRFCERLGYEQRETLDCFKDGKKRILLAKEIKYGSSS